MWGVIVRYSFVTSSTQIILLIRRPLSSTAMTKSIDQDSFGPSCRRSRNESLASALQRRLRFTQAIKMINVVNPLVINAKA